jgi:proteic killer suppression protein
MIASWRNADAERLYRGESLRRFQAVETQARTRLRRLDAAETLQDLAAFPGNRLEALRGNRKGQYSIRTNDQWRICFRWSEGKAYDVEIVDYH